MEKDILKSFDARDWADEFMVQYKNNPDINQELMVTWFANALMRGYDEHYCRSKEYKIKVRKILIPWYKRIFVPLTNFGH